MDESLETKIQNSLKEWANIEKQRAEREKKDLGIISEFCAANDAADMFHTLELLLKYKGMASHDKEKVSVFKEKYPDKLTVQLIADYNDVKDLYSRYLESGGEG